MLLLSLHPLVHLFFSHSHTNLDGNLLGIAACNIGGVTIHSFAGIGLGREPPEKLAEKIKKNKKASTRWQRTKVLIIDEGVYRGTALRSGV